MTAAYPELARIEAEITVEQGMASDDTSSGFVGLFRDYVEEWEEFTAAAAFAA